MHKEESAESTSSSVSFPVGIWSLAIKRDDGDPVYIGNLNLVEPSSPTEYYWGAMQFADDSQAMENLAGLPFPVEVISFDPANGDISFQVQGAANVFDPNTDAPYHFVFEGIYTPLAPPFLSGTAKVPKAFGSQNGLQMKVIFDDGDNVIWTSVAPR